jgi:hypothetical protein
MVAILLLISRYGQLLEFWEDVYGYKMKCMRAPILEEASVEVIQ